MFSSYNKWSLNFTTPQMVAQPLSYILLPTICMTVNDCSSRSERTERGRPWSSTMRKVGSLYASESIRKFGHVFLLLNNLGWSCHYVQDVCRHACSGAFLYTPDGKSSRQIAQSVLADALLARSSLVLLAWGCTYLEHQISLNSTQSILALILR
jgi:hypothetical protein